MDCEFTFIPPSQAPVFGPTVQHVKQGFAAIRRPHAGLSVIGARCGTTACVRARNTKELPPPPSPVYRAPLDSDQPFYSYITALFSLTHRAHHIILCTGWLSIMKHYRAPVKCSSLLDTAVSRLGLALLTCNSNTMAFRWRHRW